MSIWDASSWTGEVYDQQLSREEIDALGVALREWAAEHPLADRPLLYIEGVIAEPLGETSALGITPRDIAEAVSDDGSPLHDQVIRIFAAGLSGYRDGPEGAVTEVIDALNEDVREWQEQRG